ncbi:MAG: XRE family transcriptional regulator [Sphingobacteriales bacterium]|nr:MAG: XRE family transcriptional regulator [Sphingobacteriales bacterium]
MTAKPRIDRADIGRRLRQERDRLGLSQGELATEGEISQRTQAAWEKGEQTPTADYLARVGQAGVDVLFVVMGLHVWEVEGGPSSAVLAPDEAELLRNFRSTDDEGRAAAILVISALATRA